MSFLFKSESNSTTTPAAAVPVQFEGITPARIAIGGRNRLSVAAPGRVSLAPNQQFNRDLSLGQTRNNAQFRRLTGQIGALRGNQNAFIQARVRPLEERLDTTLADQGRAFERRGVFGSLAENELNKTRFLGEREIGDARALATNEAFTQILNTEAQIRGANEMQVEIANNRVKDELARVGLSAEFLLGLLGARRQTTQLAGGGTTTASQTPSTAGILGSILSAF